MPTTDNADGPGRGSRKRATAHHGPLAHPLNDNDAGSGGTMRGLRVPGVPANPPVQTAQSSVGDAFPENFVRDVAVTERHGEPHTVQGDPAIAEAVSRAGFLNERRRV